MNVESTSAMMILTLALVIPEREVFECVRGDSMSTSLEKISLIAHINARIFGGCVQTVRRRCRKFRNKCFGYNNSHSTVVIAEAVVQVPRVDVQCVDRECSSSHGGDR